LNREKSEPEKTGASQQEPSGFRNSPVPVMGTRFSGLTGTGDPENPGGFSTGEFPGGSD